MIESHFKDTFWLKSLINSFKSEFNESFGILKWTEDRELLSRNINQLINNKHKIILSEIIPSELTDNIDPKMLLKVKSSLIYVPPQVIETKSKGTLKKKYIILSNSKSPNFKIYKILNKNDDFDFIEINSRKDALRDLVDYDKVIIDLEDPQVTHYILLRYIKLGTNILLTGRCISVIPRLVANGIILNVCTNDNKSTREFINEIISDEKKSFSVIDEEFLQSILSFKKYNDVVKLKSNNSYNNLTCFTKVLSHYPFLDKDQFLTSKISYPPKIYSYENMGLWHTAINLINASFHQKTNILNITLSHMLDFEYCQNDIYKSDFHSINLLALICEQSTFDIATYLKNLKRKSKMYNNVFYRTFMCMVLAGRMNKCTDTFNFKSKTILKLALTTEKPGVSFRFYNKLNEFNESIESNTLILNEILNSEYTHGVNNFIYILPSFIDRNIFLEVATRNNFDKVQLPYLASGIMHSYGIWHDTFDYCDKIIINNCIETFETLNIKTFHYYILCVLADKEISKKAILNDLTSLEKFHFVLFLNRFNKFELFQRYFLLFEKSPNFLEHFKKDIRAVSLLKRDQIYPLIKNYIDLFNINQFSFSVENSPYILHYFRVKGLDLPDHLSLANKVSPSTIYSLVPLG